MSYQIPTTNYLMLMMLGLVSSQAFANNEIGMMSPQQLASYANANLGKPTSMNNVAVVNRTTLPVYDYFASPPKQNSGYTLSNYVYPTTSTTLPVINQNLTHVNNRYPNIQGSLPTNQNSSFIIPTPAYYTQSFNTNVATVLPKGVSGVTNPTAYPIGKPTFQCVIDAANAQSVPVDILLAINSIERGNTGQQVGNKNGSYDIGAFQVNSINLPRIRAMGGTEYDLSSRGCYNANIAALLLKEAINNKSSKFASWDFYAKAAGYHSWTPQYNSIYRTKLVKYTNDWRNWLRTHNYHNYVSIY